MSHIFIFIIRLIEAWKFIIYVLKQAWLYVYVGK